MADDNASGPVSPTSISATSTARDAPSTSNGNALPPGFAFRRAATLGQPPMLRRRLNGNHPPPSIDTNTFANFRRRSSTYSDYIETSADELLNPSKSHTKEEQKSPFVYIPLTLALLPAVAGVFFENGAAFFTDLIILSLAAVFLHWSVTQPWDWYHSAQQIRVVQDEILADSVFESDSEVEPMSTSATAALEDISEEKAKEAETEAKGKESSVNRNARREARQRAAVKELYVHETMALAWCFVFPVLGTYLLHTIRGQLSRPSEGLVSDYNLTIFLCAAELRPVSHLFRMLRRRTLHIQNIVAQNPHSQKLVTNDQIQALYDRLGELEAREAPKEHPLSNGVEPEVPQKLVESAVVREFRRTAQPELEALNRAMRRYEKKLTLLAGQTDDRMEYLEHRLNDAIALVAVAAKSGRSEWGLAGWLVEKTIIMIMLPFQALATVLTLPFRTASTLFYRKGQTGPEKAHRPQRSGKSPVQGKGSSDRMPTRMSRR